MYAWFTGFLIMVSLCVAVTGCSVRAAVSRNDFLQATQLYTHDANTLACYLRDHGGERGGVLERMDDAAFYALQVAQAHDYNSVEVADAMDKVKQLDYMMVRKGVKDYACNLNRAH